MKSSILKKEDRKMTSEAIFSVFKILERKGMKTYHFCVLVVPWKKVKIVLSLSLLFIIERYLLKNL